MGWILMGSNISGGEIFCTNPDQSWVPPNPILNGSWVSFPGTNSPGLGIVHLLPSSAEVKEKSRNIPQLPLWALVACSRLKINSLSLLILVPFR
jgi:hypothetical protein